jgi:hypothetical protein
MTIFIKITNRIEQHQPENKQKTSITTNKNKKTKNIYDPDFRAKSHQEARSLTYNTK